MNPYPNTAAMLNEQEKYDISQRFQMYDTDRNGNLNKPELRIMLNEYLNKAQPTQSMHDLIEDAIRQEPGDVDLWRTMNAINNIKMKAGQNKAPFYNDPTASFNYAQPQQQFVQAPPAQPFYGQPNYPPQQPFPQQPFQQQQQQPFPQQPQQFAQPPQQYAQPFSQNQPFSQPPSQQYPPQPYAQPTQPYAQPPQQFPQSNYTPQPTPTSAPTPSSMPPMMPSFTPIPQQPMMGQPPSTSMMGQQPMMGQPPQQYYPPPLQQAYDPNPNPFTSAAPNQNLPSQQLPASLMNQMQNTHITPSASQNQPTSSAAKPPAPAAGNLPMPPSVKIPSSIAKMAFVPPGSNAPVAPPPAANTAAPVVKPAAAQTPFSTGAAPTSSAMPRFPPIAASGAAPYAGGAPYPGANAGQYQAPLPTETKPRSSSYPTPAPAKVPNPFANTPISSANTNNNNSNIPPSALSSAPMAPVRVMDSRPMPKAPMKNIAQSTTNKAGDLHSSGGVQKAHTGAHHYVSHEEKRAFVEYINSNQRLREDPDMAVVLPIDPNSDMLFEVVSEGALFCKLLNTIKPGLIQNNLIKTRPKNTFEKAENHNLAITAARKLGCSVVNIGSEDLIQGKAHLVMGLLWQMIKADVLSKVSLAQHPEIYKLASNTSNLKEVSDSTPEEVLLKWANHHLNRANCGITLSNFSHDVRDGAAYAVLMNQIAPNLCTLDALREPDMARRAQMIVDNAKRLGCDRFVTAKDIETGNARLNLAFMADLFNKHSALELPSLEEMARLKQNNTNLAGVLNEAEARLRQILADGQLAYELQQQEIEEYRRFKIAEARQLAEEEAMLIEEQRREELALQSKRGNAIANQEAFAREEQRKENQKASQRPVPAAPSSYSNTRAAPYAPSTTTSSYAPPSTSSYAPPSYPASSYSTDPSPYNNNNSYPPSVYSTDTSYATETIPYTPSGAPGTTTTTTVTTTETKKEPAKITPPARLPSPPHDQQRIPIVTQPKLGFFGRAGQKIDRTFH